MAFEIINTAVPGYSTMQELTFLKLYGEKYEPDLIIVQFCLNDVVERFTTIAKYGGDNVFLGVDTRAAHGIAALSRYSKIVETMVRYKQRQGRDYQEYQVKNMLKNPLPKELEDAWNMVFSELREMNSVAASMGAPLVMLIAPYKFQLSEIRNNELPQKMLREFAGENNIEYIDLLPVFRENSKMKLFADANHFDIEGHRIAASELASFIKTKFYPPPVP